MGIPLGVVIAETVYPYETICRAKEPTFQLPSENETTCATQITAGTERRIAVFIENKSEFIPLLLKVANGICLGRLPATYRYWHMVNHLGDMPDLQLRLNNDLVELEVGEVIRSRFGAPIPLHNVRPTRREHLLDILHSASRFYWNLRHVSQNTEDSILTSSVILECCKLRRSDDREDRERGILIPGEKIKADENDGYWRINVDEKDQDADRAERLCWYGFKITNNYVNPVHVALFHFDIPTLAVCMQTSLRFTVFESVT
jgi:hypothetical protein